MVRSILLFLCALSTVRSLRVMSFNVWTAGGQVEDGLRKIADQIKYVNPDIVALQESGVYDKIDYVYQRILGYLGDGWSGTANCKGDTGVITRHKILGLSARVSTGMNARIQLSDSGREISVWSMHLQYRGYGPEEAFKEGATIDKILSGEKETEQFRGRIQNIVELLKHPEFVQQIKNSDNIPVIVAGDFNVPSHLDWTDSTKDRHNNWVVDWPVTELLSNTAGMTDSYREVNPDPVTKPGLTWTVYREYDRKVAEKDRIDFIFYRGSLRATNSYTHNGVSPIIDDGTEAWRKNEWPSDHWAVVTDFEHTTLKSGPQPAWNSFYIDPAFDKGTIGQAQNCPARMYSV